MLTGPAGLVRAARASGRGGAAAGISLGSFLLPAALAPPQLLGEGQLVVAASALVAVGVAAPLIAVAGEPRPFVDEAAARRLRWWRGGLHAALVTVLVVVAAASLLVVPASPVVIGLRDQLGLLGAGWCAVRLLGVSGTLAALSSYCAVVFFSGLAVATAVPWWAWPAAPADSVSALLAAGALLLTGLTVSARS